MNECMIIYNAHKNFHARICMFTAQGLGRKEFIVSTFMSATVRSTISTHTHTCNHMHTHTRTHTCSHRGRTSGKEDYKYNERGVS